MIADLQGMQIAYDDKGKGLPILFIHGFPLNRTLWTGQVDNISKIGRAVSIDLRGHGESQAIPGPYSMKMLAQGCNSLLNELEITEPVILCGLSMGGYVTLEFYRQYPSRVAGLILAATRSGADSAEGRANRDKAISEARHRGVTSIVDSMLPNMIAQDTYKRRPELIHQLRAMMLSTSLEGAIGALEGMKNRLDSTPILTSIRIPTLILHGAEDQIIPITVAQDMHTAIYYSTLSILPEAGHLLNLEQPDLFNQAILDFLATSYHVR